MSSESQPRQTEWEYKILVSPSGSFKKQDVFQQALQEEASAGWTLMEKFDNKRLRLKRPVSARDRDSSLDFNPYRTMTPSMVVATREANRNAWLWIGVIVFVVVIAFILLANETASADLWETRLEERGGVTRRRSSSLRSRRRSGSRRP